MLLISEKEETEQFAVILWTLWNARNRKIFEGTTPDPLAIVKFSLNYWNDFREITQKPQVDGHTDWVLSSWTPPELGAVKINFDVAIFEAENRSGAGMIARQHDGSFEAAKVVKLYGTCDSNTMEACALQKVAEWVKERGYSKVEIEGDSSTVVSFARNPSEDRSHMAMFIEEARETLNACCQWQIHWIRREANGVAHKLAAMARSFIEPSVNFFSPPNDIIHTLMADML